ncbi:MAG: ROK family protein [Firmicutes bacterium]|nr:ROK family protein [Bacillota bacterium]
MRKHYIGLDIGGTKCASVLAEADEKSLEFLSRAEFATDGTWRDVADKLCDHVVKQLAAANLNTVDIETCGISCGGPLDVKNGLILSPPNLPGWDKVPIVAYISGKLKIQTKLNNDADACAVAEWKYGAGRGSSNMVFLTFGTGLGAGLILNGKLYTGANGMAGEVGHIRLEKDGPVGYNKVGSFEGFCSGGGIAQFANGRTAKEIAIAADNGDTGAKELLARVGTYFGRGLSILIDILNPEIIVAGSIFARAGRHMQKTMYAALQKEALPQSLSACRIVPAELGDKIGDYGSIVTAML